MNIVCFDLVQNTPQHSMKFYIDTFTLLRHNWVETYPPFSMITLVRKQSKNCITFKLPNNLSHNKLVLYCQCFINNPYVFFFNSLFSKFYSFFHITRIHIVVLKEFKIPLTIQWDFTFRFLLFWGTARLKHFSFSKWQIQCVNTISWRIF